MPGAAGVSDRNGERGADIPPRMQRIIERERRRLGRATALLRCLVVASMYDEELDVTDIAEVVRRLVDRAIDRLDAVELRRVVPKRARGAPRV
jgi:hypothetical protein